MTYQRGLGDWNEAGPDDRRPAGRTAGQPAQGSGKTTWAEQLLPALYQEFDTLSLPELTYMPNQISDQGWR